MSSVMKLSSFCTLGTINLYARDNDEEDYDDSFCYYHLNVHHALSFHFIHMVPY